MPVAKSGETSENVWKRLPPWPNAAMARSGSIKSRLAELALTHRSAALITLVACSPHRAPCYCPWLLRASCQCLFPSGLSEVTSASGTYSGLGSGSHQDTAYTGGTEARIHQSLRYRGGILVTAQHTHFQQNLSCMLTLAVPLEEAAIIALLDFVALGRHGSGHC